jgi:hypothetical protein
MSDCPSSEMKAPEGVDAKLISPYPTGVVADSPEHPGTVCIWGTTYPVTGMMSAKQARNR